MFFEELKERKKNILNKIVSIDAIKREGNLSPELSALRALRKGELKDLLLREEMHWRQKVSMR